MPRPYNYNYDLYILEALFENETLGFREIKRILEKKINRKISFETFNYHIKKLKEDNYIKSSNNKIKRGQKLFYCLTDLIKQGKKLGIIHTGYGNEYTFQKIQGNRERLEHIYYTILYIIAVKPPPLVHNEEYDNQQGVTIKDLTCEYSSVTGYSYIKLRLTLVKKALNFIENEGLIEKIEIEGAKEHYYIPCNGFGRFVQECIEIFQHHILLRYTYLWRTIRPPKPKERKILEMLWDKEYVNQQILDFKEELRKNKQTDTYRDLYKKKREWIEIFDHNIFNVFEEIKKNYSDLFIKYPIITNYILNVYYPKSLRDEIKDFNKKHKYRKYPRGVMASFISEI